MIKQAWKKSHSRVLWPSLLSLFLAAQPVMAAEPTSVKGLTLWLSADDRNGDGVADDSASGAKIAKWSDKSGLGNHVEQPSEQRQPTLQRDALGGQAALRFDGGDCLQLAKVAGMDAGDQPFYAVFVMQAAMAGQHPNPRLLDLRGDDFESKEPRRGFWVGYQNNGRNRLGIAYGDEGEATRVAWSAKPNLLEVVYQGRGSWAQYLNGKPDGRGTFSHKTFLGFRKPIRLAIGQH